jgi:circadian clock protein KaiC
VTGTQQNVSAALAVSLPKAATGIRGFDEITEGGLPAGRATLVAGAAGTGKTLFGIEFLVHGVARGEPGVLLTFEESADKVKANVASLGVDLDRLQADGHLVVQSFPIDTEAIVAAGPFDLEGLFVALGCAVDRIGARRVAIDTVEVLFAAFGNEAVIRSEITRLFRWLEQRGLTAVVTGERGESSLTRRGIEEYLSDCVILLDQRIHENISTRRLRVVKYRGSGHGTNEYPFTITDRGITVMPITSVGLSYPAFTERVSTGVPRLDNMLGGGLFRGSTVLISGSAGTGKSSLAAQAADAACTRGERVLHVLFEESPAQLVRNMRSIGVDLQQWVDAGLLRFMAGRPGSVGLESHLVALHRELEEFRPDLAVLDAVSGLLHIGLPPEVIAAVTRQLDMLKNSGTTCLLTSLVNEGEISELSVSSLVDTWLLLRNVETNGERNRLLFVTKSRGTAHSNQVREFRLTDHGIELVDVYVGEGGVLTGTARLSQQARERQAAEQHRLRVGARRRELRRRSAELGARISRLNQELAEEQAELQRLENDEAHRDQSLAVETAAMAHHRWQDSVLGGTV